MEYSVQKFTGVFGSVQRFIRYFGESDNMVNSKFFNIATTLISKKTLPFLVLVILAFGYSKRHSKLRIFYKKTGLNTFLIEGLQQLIKGYSPTVWLPGNLLKPLYLNTKPHGFFKDRYTRIKHRLQDGEVIALDFWPRRNTQTPCLYEEKQSPIIVFLPGIIGTSLNHYTLEMLNIVKRRLKNWRVCIINRRGYGGMEYHANRITSFDLHSDTHGVIQFIQKENPGCNLYLLSISMGATHCVRYLENYGLNTPIKACSVIACPWDCGNSSNDIVKKNGIANKVLVKSFKEHLKRHLHDLGFHKMLEKKGVKEEELQSFTSKRQVDEFLAKDAGCSTLQEYYDSVASHKNVDKIRIPLMSINSEDDMICPLSSIPLEEIKKNKNIIEIIAKGGGHIEYFSGIISPKMWGFEMSLEYFRIHESIYLKQKRDIKENSAQYK